MSNETGEFQIYVEPWPQTGVRFQATRDGGNAPVWSADGSQIYYERSGRLYAVRFQNGLEMFSRPRELPIVGFVASGLRRNWDLMPDGRQFLMLYPGPSVIGVVTSWKALGRTR
jgi:hypothetical protein